ncbi:hypothetical protein [Streptomyces sp. NPDC002537]
MTGASAIVSAMATTAWEEARERTVALFRRRHDAGHGDGGESAGRDSVRAELEASAARVLDAADQEAARQDQERRWRVDLEDLLRGDPGAADELRALTDEVRGRVRVAQPVWHQNIVAGNGGSAYGALGPGSSVHIHHHAPPYPPSAPRPADPGGTGS